MEPAFFCAGEMDRPRMKRAGPKCPPGGQEPFLRQTPWRDAAGMPFARCSCRGRGRPLHVILPVVTLPAVFPPPLLPFSFRPYEFTDSYEAEFAEHGLDNLVIRSTAHEQHRR